MSHGYLIDACLSVIRLCFCSCLFNLPESHYSSTYKHVKRRIQVHAYGDFGRLPYIQTTIRRIRRIYRHQRRHQRRYIRRYNDDISSIYRRHIDDISTTNRRIDKIDKIDRIVDSAKQNSSGAPQAPEKKGETDNVRNFNDNKRIYSATNRRLNSAGSPTSSQKKG